MFNRKSEHALNKKEKDYIVYPDAYGNIIRLSAEDFSSTKEFRKWRNWTKMRNHSDEKKDHRHRNHTVSFDEFNGVVGEILDVEYAMVAQEELSERQDTIAVLVGMVKECLSETQYRRMWMYYALEMDTYDIAKLEGITHQAVSDSVQSAKRKILKYVKKHLAK